MKESIDIKQLRSDNYSAFLLLTVPAVLLVSGVYFSVSGNTGLFIFGQVLLSVFFFQCFILLHEAGHHSFFSSRTLNIILGNVCAFISFIPFKSWVEIHNLHHRWTGWRDKDPTTSDTVRPNSSKLTRMLVNTSWMAWFPLFTIVYRFGNYWKIKKLKKYLDRKKLRSVYINMFVQVLIYVPLFVFFGDYFVRYFLAGYIVSLIISDVFILSQHSHIEMPLAGDSEVKALRYAEQVKYTRSISFKTLAARFLYFNFNLHELHHEFPGLPAYHLHKIDYDTPNKVGFYAYLYDAKRMKGSDFVLNTSDKQIGKRKK